MIFISQGIPLKNSNLVGRLFCEMKKWVFEWWDLSDRVYSFPGQSDWFHFRLVAFGPLVASLFVEVKNFQNIKSAELNFYRNRKSFSRTVFWPVTVVSLNELLNPSISVISSSYTHGKKQNLKKMYFYTILFNFCSFRTLKTVFFLNYNKLFEKLDVIKAKDK